MGKSLEDLASPYVKGLIPYSPGKPVEEVERELGIRESIKLASNENPLGPSPMALQAMREVLATVNRYPDGGGFSLRAALARKLEVQPDQVILGNGSNELLELCARVFLLPDDEAVMADPAFVVYPMVAQACGARKVRVPLRDFTHDLEAMATAITPRTKVVFIGNPNNPTGTCVTPEALYRFMDRVPPEVIVVVDEAYREFLPPPLQPDSLRYVRAGRPILVLRTFSKIYGLAGLRIGYGAAPAAMVEIMNRVRQPFNTNLLAQHAARAALEDANHVANCRRLNELGRKYLQEQFAALGVSTVPTVANFVLVDVGRDGPPVAEALMRRGIIVRPMAGYGLPTYLRITIGTPVENEKCVAALRAVLAV